MPSLSTFSLVSGRRLSVSVSRLDAFIFPFTSTADIARSTLPFAVVVKSRPRSSTPSSTDAFGAAPLKGAANTFIPRPLRGIGLLIASSSSGDSVPVVGDGGFPLGFAYRSEEHTSELQSQSNLVCRLMLVKKKINVHVTSI